MEKGKPHYGVVWNLFVVVALILVTVEVEGQRPRPPFPRPRPPGPRPRPPGPRPRPPPPSTTQVRYEWMRDVGGDASITESADVVEERNHVIFRSVDRNIRAANMTNALILYDFNAPNGGVAAVMPLPGPRQCFLFPIVNSTFNSTSELVESYNGTVVTADAAEAFDGTGRFLPMRQTVQIYRRNPALRFHCRFSRLVRVQPISGEPPAEARELTIPDVDGVISLFVRGPPPPPS